jgi:hypothetical protein
MKFVPTVFNVEFNCVEIIADLRDPFRQRKDLALKMNFRREKNFCCQPSSESSTSSVMLVNAGYVTNLYIYLIYNSTRGALTGRYQK